MDTVLQLIGRKAELFTKDIKNHNKLLCEIITSSRFLVIGGAGSIGQAVCREIFSRNPVALHIVDISENNLTELVRDIRSTLGYISGDFQALPLDCGSPEYDVFIASQEPYDYIFNLSAMKHVRSEKDAYSLMRMIRVNILNTDSIAKKAAQGKSKNFFCVSTDKAANPVNMMGASKRVMEHFLMRRSLETSVSMARFANVAFSDGSLLHGFKQRLQKLQPISAPRDIQRYFLTSKESGELCLMSGLLGKNRDIFFPKLDEHLHTITFAEIAERFLRQHGYEPYLCSTEEESRAKSSELIQQKQWPCFFFNSDTTGEKPFEEFYTVEETLDMHCFHNIGIIKNKVLLDNKKLDEFEIEIRKMLKSKQWTKPQIIELFSYMLPDFQHEEKSKNLDGKM